MVEHSSRLAIKTMKLKDQAPQGIYTWTRVGGQRTVTSIPGLVVVNDSKQKRI